LRALVSCLRRNLLWQNDRLPAALRRAKRLRPRQELCHLRVVLYDEEFPISEFS